MPLCPLEPNWQKDKPAAPLANEIVYDHDIFGKPAPPATSWNSGIGYVHHTYTYLLCGIGTVPSGLLYGYFGGAMIEPTVYV